MKLMEIDSVTRLPKPTAEVLLIPIFSKLWKRSNKVDGDRKGTGKILNEKEFGYIYYMCVYDSRFRYLNDKDKSEKVMKLLDLPEGWEPDSMVLEAMKVFNELNLTAGQELVDTLDGTASDLSFWIRSKRAGIKAGTTPPRDVTEILGIIEALPKTLETIKKAKDVLGREQEALSSGRKGRSLNKFELPN